MNKIFKLNVTPEESIISLGFDYIDMDAPYMRKNDYATSGYDLLIDTVFEDNYVDENDEWISIVNVQIILTESYKFFSDYQTELNDLTDYADNRLNINKAKYLGIYEMLEIGLTDNTYDYLDVSEYSYTEYRIFRSEDKKEIIVLFYVK